MNAKCTLTGETVLLKDIAEFDMQIPAAICECRRFEDSNITTHANISATLSGNCNQENCSAIWFAVSDTYNGVLNSVPQCENIISINSQFCK